MTRHTRADRIYAFAVPLCLIAPAVVPIAIERFVVLSALLTGLPLSIMAALLATLHAQYRLQQALHRATALAWLVGAVLLVTPLPAWISSLERR